MENKNISFDRIELEIELKKLDQINGIKLQ